MDLRAQDGWIELTVADDGAGFSAERLDQALAAGHIGLSSVDERVCAVGGSVAIDGAAGSGASIRVRLPEQDPSAALTADR